ncbi:hypothetical protein KDL01_34355 [Actinospica durhamensis]|uniref:Uncharacterized protein n=1 Tax=Actinospica durhamensis TaxID=1508375 RepID=A0A941EXZ3_9ACTN|nr:hypothetical protein [Actinospica durhamensis]MBR7838402.1 hypothetical protein [Actinospica durhamensis]
MSDFLFPDRFADRLDAKAQAHPPWTIRCTWRVTDSRDEPFRTYHGADSEISALDRAVFVLDHYRHEAADELVCVDVLHPGGWWANVPSSSTHLSPPPAVLGLDRVGPTG